MKYNTILAAVFALSIARADTAYISVYAFDEVSGAPVENCEVEASFDQNDDPWFCVKCSKSPKIVKGRTDKDGRCLMKGKTPTGYAWVNVESVPDGYYIPWAIETLRSREKNWLGVWQPEDTVVTLKLQRIERPIPLYVNRTVAWPGDSDPKDVFSGNGERAQLDLVKGDWLPPNGTGEVADVEFVRKPREDLGETYVPIVQNRGRMYRDTMEMRFLGENNGIVEMATERCHLMKIRTAPEAGYGQMRIVSQWRDKELKIKASWDENKSYCIRIRSKTDANGKLIDGLYGKIYGDIKFVHVQWKDIPIGNVGMQYYLNLTPLDRNLEWNRENLCPAPRVLIGYGL